MTILQAFLLINAVLIGAVVTLAVQYAMAHKRSTKQVPRAQNPNSPLSPELRSKLTKQAEENFQGIVNRASLQLQHDLTATGTQLNKLLDKFGTDVLDEEMKLFRKNVADIRGATQTALSGSQDEISKQQAAILQSLADRQKQLDEAFVAKQTELEAGLETVYKERQLHIQQELDTKLNDAVLAFLNDALGQNIDLGAQTSYILETLNEHKAELVGGAGRES